MLFLSIDINIGAFKIIFKMWSVNRSVTHAARHVLTGARAREECWN